MNNHYEIIKKEIAELRESGFPITLTEFLDEYCLINRLNKEDLRMEIRYADSIISSGNNRHWDEIMSSGEYTSEGVHNPIELDRKLAMVEYYEKLPPEFQTIKIKKKLADLRKEIAKDGLDKWGKEVVEALF